MTSNELLKVKELVTGDKYDEVIANIKQAFKDAHTDNDLSGWGIQVVIDAEGESSVTGIMSNNSSLRSVWDGEEVVVASVGTYSALEDFSMEQEIAGHKLEKEIREGYKAAEENQDYFYLHDYVLNEYPEVAEELEKAHVEWFFDEFTSQFASCKYDEFIERLDEEIEQAQYVESQKQDGY